MGLYRRLGSIVGHSDRGSGDEAVTPYPMSPGLAFSDLLHS